MTIFEEIKRERRRQIKKGLGEIYDRRNSQNDWVAHISVYTGRAASQLRINHEDCDFRENMIKVAALAVAAIEACDEVGTDG